MKSSSRAIGTERFAASWTIAPSQSTAIWSKPSQRKAITAQSHHALADELYRYLNFFEFLAGLRGLGQISDEEIIGLFDYDLRLITQHDFIMSTLRPQGFERLADLLASGRLLPRS